MAKTYEWKGETRTAHEWFKHLGLPKEIQNAFYVRLYLHGWDVGRAATTPLGGRPENIYANRPKADKNTAELRLNDSSIDDLPKYLVEALKTSTKKVKYGEFIRRKHKNLFDRWYNEEFLKSFTNDSITIPAKGTEKRHLSSVN